MPPLAAGAVIVGMANPATKRPWVCRAESAEVKVLTALAPYAGAELVCTLIVKLIDVLSEAALSESASVTV